MPMPDLLAALERDAGKQADAILGAARAEAERVTAEAEARIASRTAAARTATQAARRGELEWDLARARRDAAIRVLTARTRLLERVERAIRQLLPEAAHQTGYLDTLEAAVREALAGIGSSPVEIRCTPSLLDLLRRLVSGWPGASVIADEGIGSGFIAASVDGHVTVDATLEARLARERPHLAVTAMALLETVRSGAHAMG